MPQARQIPAKRRVMTTQAVTGTAAGPVLLVANSAWLTGIYATAGTANDTVVIYPTTGTAVMTVRIPAANSPVFINLRHPVYCEDGINIACIGTGTFAYTLFYAEHGVG